MPDILIRRVSKAHAGGMGAHQFPAKLAGLQIAGIAMAYDLTLAIRDVQDFEGIGRRLVEPWAEGASSTAQSSN